MLWASWGPWCDGEETKKVFIYLLICAMVPNGSPWIFASITPSGPIIAGKGVQNISRAATTDILIFPDTPPISPSPALIRKWKARGGSYQWKARRGLCHKFQGAGVRVALCITSKKVFCFQSNKNCSVLLPPILCNLFLHKNFHFRLSELWENATKKTKQVLGLKC